MIAAGILTWNQIATGRAGYFQRTLASLRVEADRWTVVTNGSTDGTDAVVRGLGGIVDGGDTRVFHGMTVAAKWCLDSGADVILFSADDIEYRPGWARALQSFWDAAPENIVLASLMVEPVYPWNTIIDSDRAGGQPYITRTSVGGCCWSFRARDFGKIFPLPAVQPTEDLLTCQKLMGQGYEIAALDLADHIGEQHSAWGNESWKYARPVDKSLYGFEERL